MTRAEDFTRGVSTARMALSKWCLTASERFPAAARVTGQPATQGRQPNLQQSHLIVVICAPKPLLDAGHRTPHTKRGLCFYFLRSFVHADNSQRTLSLERLAFCTVFRHRCLRSPHLLHRCHCHRTNHHRVSNKNRTAPSLPHISSGLTLDYLFFAHTTLCTSCKTRPRDFLPFTFKTLLHITCNNDANDVRLRLCRKAAEGYEGTCP